MENVIPYDKDLCYDGGFISPEGKILYTPFGHEGFAMNYLRGIYYESLVSMKYGKTEPDFDFLRENFNFNGSIEDIDEYASSPLSPEKREELKRWEVLHAWHKKNNAYSDFMVHVLGFDKVESVMRRRITTTSRQPNIRFYNYRLMDWDVVSRNPMRYIPDEDDFDYVEDDTDIWINDDYVADQEIEELRGKILWKDRPLFFKGKRD